MSNLTNNVICQYYFNDLSNNNINNYKTSTYDLSLVNVGTASFPTITLKSVSPLLTPSLYQTTTSNANYSYYVNNSNTNIRNLTGSFSVSFWIYIDPSLSSFGTVWCLYNDTSNNLITYSQQVGDGQTFFSITLNGQKFYIGGLLTKNIYNHVVLTCSTSGNTSTIQYYVNGVKASFNNATFSGNRTDISYNSTPGTITVTGSLFDGTNTLLYVLGGPSGKGITFPVNNPSESQGFNGYLGQLTLYNTALTQSDITYLYTNPYPLPITPCFLQGSKILKFDPITNTESYVPVETLRKGNLIKTIMSGYKPISHIGWKELENPADALDVRDRLYGLSPKQLNPNSEFDEPLYLTGRHSVLRNDLTESDLNILRKYMGDVYVTENHYRVQVFLDRRANPYTDKKPVIIWHFALENENIYQNYGVMANGILVESSSIEYMTDHSNMKLLQ